MLLETWFEFWCLGFEEDPFFEDKDFDGTVFGDVVFG